MVVHQMAKVRPPFHNRETGDRPSRQSRTVLVVRTRLLMSSLDSTLALCSFEIKEEKVLLEVLRPANCNT